MKHGFIKFALCSPTISVGDPVLNRTNIETAIKAAAKNKAEVIVFGMRSLTGSSLLSAVKYSQLLSSALTELKRLVDFSGSYNPLIIVSLPAAIDCRTVTLAAVIQSGRLLCLVPDQKLPIDKTVILGQEYDLSPLKLIKIDNLNASVGIVFNDDFYKIVPDSQKLVLGGADIIINLASSPALIDSHRNRISAIAETSKRLKCAYIYVSTGDGESVASKVYSGDKIASENGQTIASGEDDETKTVYAEIDTDAVRSARLNTFEVGISPLPCIFTDVKISSSDLTRPVSRLPFVPESGEFDRIFDIMARALITRMREVNAKKVILGLSGGLDSTMALLTSERTFRKYGLPLKDIVCVTMPTENSSARTKNNAQKLIDILKVTGLDIPIDGLVKQQLNTISHDSKSDTVYENVQSRERTQILLNLANKFNALMLGTGDLSEAALGWSTYGGDQLAHYNPGSSLSKTLIRAMIRNYCLTTANTALAGVLNSVLSTPISPELLKNQDTEKSIGSYELHDFFLYNLIGKGYTLDKTYFLAVHTFFDHDKKEILTTLKTFIIRFFKNQFKRSASCDGVQLSEYDLSDIQINSEFSDAVYLKGIERLERELKG